MNNAIFIHIYVNPKKGVSLEKVEEQMNLAIDWYRYENNSYLVYTTSNIEKWMGRLKPLVESDGRLLIFEIKIQRRNGWMPKDFWEWLKMDRNNKLI
jgi:hypothetical protein